MTRDDLRAFLAGLVDVHVPGNAELSGGVVDGNLRKGETSSGGGGGGGTDATTLGAGRDSTHQALPLLDSDRDCLIKT